MSADCKMGPTSYGQQRLWFFDRLQPRSPLYNMHHVQPLPGGLDAGTTQRALSEMIRRHEVLRTTFRGIDGRPVQVIHPPEPANLPLIDLSEQPEETRAREFRRLMEKELTRGFDLENGPLLSFLLVKLEHRQHILSICIHHIVFDDWSVDIFDREFTSIYEDLKAGRPISPTQLPIQYAEFAVAQRAQYDRDALDPQLGYWRKRLHGLPASSELPTDRPRPPIQTFRGAIRTFALASTVARGFRDLTRGADATLFMSLFAAFAVLISRYSGQTDLAVGTPIANRNRPELANLIGFFVNTLVLRLELGDDPSFLELLGQAREMALGALANQDVPLELLVEELRPDRDASRQPMFQIMFVFQFGRGGSDDGGSEDAVSSGAKFDLTLTATDAAPHIRGAFEYNTDLFDPATMQRMATHYETLIASIVAEPHRRISELAVIDRTERQHIIEDWNATATDPPPACVQDIVAEIAAAQPEAVAVTFGSTTLTYGELDRRAAVLAGQLRALGVGPEIPVGLCLDRSPEWVVSMLGTLKAGGAMVPLDPALPPSRLAFMIEDAEIGIVLTQTSHSAKLEGVATRVIRVEETTTLTTAPLDGHRAEPANLAYIIYTSGSTGQPKGVLVEHAGFANLAMAQGRAWMVGPASRVLQFASLGFDAAMSEVFSTLCLGGRLCLAPADDLMPGPPLLRTLRELRITHVTLPPSGLAAMQPESLPDLMTVISAGEFCDPGLARRWAQGRRLVNAYGPTEITVCATMHSYDGSAADFPIGRPIANMQVYVLDRHGAPVPPGVTGEIHVGGVGVARGYLNRPELTAERFIEDRLSGRPGARLYRTGDLGRFDASGTLHYVTRVDNQLKIRGYRIEPGEIESVLRLHPQVSDCVILGLGSGADARLLAYVIPTKPPPLVIELRSFLGRHLPDYMAPAAYVMVEAWPKTPNGKIDRAALPRPDSLARNVSTAFVNPESALEQTIASIWRACLGVAQVGATDNFFDLGGHSLLLVRVHDRLREALKTDLSLIDLFRYPTVKLLAETIGAKTSGQTQTEVAAAARADQRAALQNAARKQRRHRTAADRHA